MLYRAKQYYATDRYQIFQWILKFELLKDNVLRMIHIDRNYLNGDRILFLFCILYKERLLKCFTLFCFSLICSLFFEQDFKHLNVDYMK